MVICGEDKSVCVCMHCVLRERVSMFAMCHSLLSFFFFSSLKIFFFSVNILFRWRHSFIMYVALSNLHGVVYTDLHSEMEVKKKNESFEHEGKGKEGLRMEVR